jgi:tol-pal system protein YbgF
MMLAVKVRTCLLLLVAVPILVVGCRPSQQAKRNDTRVDSRNNAQGGDKTMDSILLVQNHLVDLLDTMSSTLEHDRDRIRNLETEVARLRSLLEQQRLQSSAPAQVPLPPTISSPTYTAPPPSAIAPGSQLPSMNATSPYADQYAHALQTFNEGKYEVAYNAFDQLAAQDAQSRYTPNYFFWRGESAYQLGRYADARASFRAVLDKYPSSAKADDAAFSVGECEERLGNKAAARSAYQHLLAVYPDSEYRSRVESRLRKLQ